MKPLSGESRQGRDAGPQARGRQRGGGTKPRDDFIGEVSDSSAMVKL